jgi:hypothetical protein
MADGDSKCRKKDSSSKPGTTQLHASMRSKQRAKAVRKEVGLMASD